MHPNDGRVISNFIIQALLDKDLTVYGDGTQTRSFCYVDDLVDGLIKLMATKDQVTGPINIGNPGEFSMLELAGDHRNDRSRSRIVTVPCPKMIRASAVPIFRAHRSCCPGSLAHLSKKGWFGRSPTSRIS